MSGRWRRCGMLALTGVAGIAVLACSERAPRATPTPTPPAVAASSTPAPAASPSPPQSTPTSTPTASATPAAAAVASYRDATYEINGRAVTLKDGVLEVEAAPGSASKITTRVFGNEATGDLTGDGQPDVALLLTQSPGGSGTFFYVVAALKTATGYRGTNAVLLGDRIAPQTTRIVDGVIEVNYADRPAGAPMTAQPSVGITKRLRITDGRLVEIR